MKDIIRGYYKNIILSNYIELGSLTNSHIHVSRDSQNRPATGNKFVSRSLVSGNLRHER